MRIPREPHANKCNTLLHLRKRPSVRRNLVSPWSAALQDIPFQRRKFVERIEESRAVALDPRPSGSVPLVSGSEKAEALQAKCLQGLCCWLRGRAMNLFKDSCCRSLRASKSVELRSREAPYAVNPWVTGSNPARGATSSAQ